jgi:hypothetical protein
VGRARRLQITNRADFKGIQRLKRTIRDATAKQLCCGAKLLCTAGANRGYDSEDFHRKIANCVRALSFARFMRAIECRTTDCRPPAWQVI